MTNNPNIYDQSNIPDSVFEKMKELKEIESKLAGYNQLIERKNDLLNEIKSEFPSENGAIAVRDNLVVQWKLGNRRIGKPDLSVLKEISPYLVRTIPEKVTPAETKAQTLTKIEAWMDMKEFDELKRKVIYDVLDITQSKSLTSETI